MLLGITAEVNFAFYGFQTFMAPYIAQAFYAHLTATQAMQQAEVLATGSLARVYATSLLGGGMWPITFSVIPGRRGWHYPCKWQVSQ